MVIPDTDLNVWLDVQTKAGQTIIVPYIKSPRELTAHYTITVERASGTSTSKIKQAGVAIVHAEKPKALSTLQLGPEQPGQCNVEVSVRSSMIELGPYQFVCQQGTASPR